jgi:hypothetical protein
MEIVSRREGSPLLNVEQDWKISVGLGN